MPEAAQTEFWRDLKPIVDYLDVHDSIDLCKEHYEEVGLGAGAIDALLR